jgi:hypothetical protein
MWAGQPRLAVYGKLMQVYLDRFANVNASLSALQVSI